MRGESSYAEMHMSTSHSRPPSQHANHSLSNSSLTIVYYNARSLLPKMDELATIADAHSPDLICIVESWLSDDIPSDEISLNAVA